MADALADETVMPPDLKARWLKALRSGRYAQGTGTLRKHDKFCCLGVLCDVIDSESWQENPSGIYTQRVHDGDNLLPTTMEQRAGLPSDSQWDLANMNDMGRSFKAIADHIEANL